MNASDGPRDSYDRAITPSDLPFNVQSNLAKLEKKRVLERENRQAAIPKIQKVQPYLRNRKNFARYYSPKLVSIGPIHRGDKDSQENLKGGEHYKIIWAAMYLEDTKQSAESLFVKIRSNLSALKELYTDDAIESFVNKDEELAWIFLLDGCAVLGFVREVVANKCPKAKLKIKTDQLVLVQQDLLLLENQLPYQLLRLLSNGPETELNNCILQFLGKHFTKPDGDDCRFTRQVSINVDHDQAPHLLHLLRQFILVDPESDISNERRPKEFPAYRNIQELKAAGISVIKARTGGLTDICFDWGITSRGFGRLLLSKLTVDDLMLPKFLNLIAYEMCPDFVNRYGISSYIAFLDSLIDHPDDVKHLRRTGVLHNALGSDEEVAQLFNIISTDLMPDTERYSDIRAKLEGRYNWRALTWLAQFLHDRFRSPWALLGFAGAIIALVLTFLQTWLAMHPPPPPPHSNA